MPATELPEPPAERATDEREGDLISQLLSSLNGSRREAEKAPWLLPTQGFAFNHHPSLRSALTKFRTKRRGRQTYP